MKVDTTGWKQEAINSAEVTSISFGSKIITVVQKSFKGKGRLLPSPSLAATRNKEMRTRVNSRVYLMKIRTFFNGIMHYSFADGGSTIEAHSDKLIASGTSGVTVQSGSI